MENILRKQNTITEPNGMLVNNSAKILVKVKQFYDKVAFDAIYI